jgi:TPR repeat protein
MQPSMRRSIERSRESGRALIVMLVLVGLSTGTVYWHHVSTAPERFFEEGNEAAALRNMPAAAVAWEESRARGHTGATVALARLYLTGQGVSRNHRRAFELFQEGANVGDRSAQLELARLYADGRGVETSHEDAALWFFSAAKAGEPAAQYEMGRIHELGRSVPANDAEAATWYRSAATAGYGEGQLALGILYDEGRGVPSDAAEAAHWFVVSPFSKNLATMKSARVLPNLSEMNRRQSLPTR